MSLPSPAERDLARAALRRFATAELTPAELAVELERWEQHRALLAGDLEAEDYSEMDAEALRAAIAYADEQLTQIERQATRLLRARISGGAAPIDADFEKARYADLVGLAETLTATPARKRGDRHLMTCPFHEDWQPSLVIYPPGRGWHCFQCGRGGRDAASFAAEFFDTSQLEGLRWVQQMAEGVRSGRA